MAGDLVHAYRTGLGEILARGKTVPSVLGAKSKASNFGKGDRPWVEIIAQRFSVRLHRPQVVYSPIMPMHFGYLFGLLAWTLDGRCDLSTLEYYRTAARDYSDDGRTMCGSFGARLALGEENGQFAALLERLKADQSSRRTFAPIITAADNVVESLEYPCAAGVQLFLRDGELHWLTFMRAQQALTILPYDAFLFSCLHHFTASFLEQKVGDYIHFSGTFHIYENECELARRVIDSDICRLDLPAIPQGKATSVARELIEVERAIRVAGAADDRKALQVIADESLQWEFAAAAREHLLGFARAPR